MTFRKAFPVILTAVALTAFTACGQSSATGSTSDSAAQADTSTSGSTSASDTGEATTGLPKLDNTRWQYSSDDDVYYQLGIQYCETPADADYEQLAILVPGAYMDAEENGDGTYTCTLNTSGTVGGYTAQTAPIVMPVNTPGYSAQSPMTQYSSVSEYTGAGFIYVHAGCRGRDAGAPAGVTDLKAAIRYLRYNSGNIAGNTDRIFSFGMSGGGAQSALLGVTGDSSLYDKYLEEIGAVEGVSDAVLGSQAWCPITSLDSADEAYEWMMGNTRSGLSDEEQTISDDLTAAYADYINGLSLTDTEGNTLTLEESSDGRYQAGTYYEYMKGIIEESLNNFLSDTTFPYDADSAGGDAAGGGMAGGPGGDGRASLGGTDDAAMGRSGFPANADGSMTGKTDFPAGTDGAPKGRTGGFAAEASSEAAGEGNTQSQNTDFSQIDDINRSADATAGVSISGTYETAQDYIDALNADGEWVTYDADTNTAQITDIAAFSAAVKPVSKGIGAFDQLDASQGENTLFGYGDGNGAHFDADLAAILEEIGSDYADSYAEDLEKTDSVGNTVDVRLDMYSPLYYLMESSDGYQTSNVANYFRINTGLWQSDTAVNTEANLALALKNYGSDVEYSFVWGMQHTMAERSGNSTDNFISWVNSCLE